MSIRAWSFSLLRMFYDWRISTLGRAFMRMAKVVLLMWLLTLFAMAPILFWLSFSFLSPVFTPFLLTRPLSQVALLMVFSPISYRFSICLPAVDWFTNLIHRSQWSYHRLAIQFLAFELTHLFIVILSFMFQDLFSKSCEWSTPKHYQWAKGFWAIGWHCINGQLM